MSDPMGEFREAFDAWLNEATDFIKEKFTTEPPTAPPPDPKPADPPAAPKKKKGWFGGE